MHRHAMSSPVDCVSFYHNSLVSQELRAPISVRRADENDCCVWDARGAGMFSNFRTCSLHTLQWWLCKERDVGISLCPLAILAAFEEIVVSLERNLQDCQPTTFCLYTPLFIAASLWRRMYRCDASATITAAEPRLTSQPSPRRAFKQL